MNFLASPELVTAVRRIPLSLLWHPFKADPSPSPLPALQMSFSGSLDFNPMTDSLLDKDGKPFKFTAPSGTKLPEAGFTPGSSRPSTPPSPHPRR